MHNKDNNWSAIIIFLLGTTLQIAIPTIPNEIENIN